MLPTFNLSLLGLVGDIGIYRTHLYNVCKFDLLCRI